ncbi:MAG: cupin domain-containing protein [Nitrososphaeria archaeon]|nr:cupin domain-containing protein [Nitrososphaeria archaeon]NIN53008.1 cupin domain-containing protein [Nitrososphaeria archaeon]NIQ33567.1 cupin domain-containing protein [Nitrososphaeria archaeon]
METYLIRLSETPKKTLKTIPGFTLQKIVLSENVLVDYDVMEPRRGTPIHRHPSEEIWFIVRGKGFIKVRGKRYEFEEHDFLYVPAGVEHQLVNTGEGTLEYVAVLSPPMEPSKDLIVVEEFSSEHLTG